VDRVSNIGVISSYNTYLKVRVTNSWTSPLRNIEIIEVIPKDVASSASQIKATLNSLF